MTTSTHAESALYRKNQPPHRASRLSAAAAEPSLEFGRFQALLRQPLPPVRAATANVVERCRNGGPLLEGNK
ncbi:MAG TPA: hypothetical protein VGG69_00575 [Rhizomicrobium sp.]|jgi:hypothetical protein